jgi:hypothetical protein
MIDERVERYGGDVGWMVDWNLIRRWFWLGYGWDGLEPELAMERGSKIYGGGRVGYPTVIIE